jgi:hypothetical protein
MRTIITTLETTVIDWNIIEGGKPRRTETRRTETVDLFHYDELSPDAKRAACEEAIESEWQDPFGHFAFAGEDMYRAVQGIEKQTPLTFESYGYANDVCVKYIRESDPDAYTLDDDGECYSIDLCELWNKHLPEMQRIAKRFENEDGDDYDYGAYEEWQSLMRSIGDDMARYITRTLDAEQEYYTSVEFWDEWLSDGDEWFTMEGAMH